MLILYKTWSEFGLFGFTTLSLGFLSSWYRSVVLLAGVMLVTDKQMGRRTGFGCILTWIYLGEAESAHHACIVLGVGYGTCHLEYTNVSFKKFTPQGAPLSNEHIY